MSARSIIPPEWAAPVLSLDQIDSTQTLARRIAEDGCPNWTIVTAKRQAHGRGRLGRKWSSGPGGLYFSLVLRPGFPPSALPDFSLRCANILAQTVARETGLKTTVKAPNDVLAAAEGKFKKVCGILIEATGDSRRTEWVVVGVGLNINNKVPKALPQAASLSSLTGRKLDEPKIAQSVFSALKKGLEDQSWT